METHATSRQDRTCASGNDCRQLRRGRCKKHVKAHQALAIKCAIKHANTYSSIVLQQKKRRRSRQSGCKEALGKHGRNVSNQQLGMTSATMNKHTMNKHTNHCREIHEQGQFGAQIKCSLAPLRGDGREARPHSAALDQYHHCPSFVSSRTHMEHKHTQVAPPRAAAVRRQPWRRQPRSAAPAGGPPQTFAFSVGYNHGSLPGCLNSDSVELRCLALSATPHGERPALPAAANCCCCEPQGLKRTVADWTLASRHMGLCSMQQTSSRSGKRAKESGK